MSETAMTSPVAEALAYKHPRDLKHDDRISIQREMMRARAEEARLLEEAKKKDERMETLLRYARIGLSAFHGRLCEMHGAHPSNPSECTDDTCQRWLKAVSP